MRKSVEGPGGQGVNGGMVVDMLAVVQEKEEWDGQLTDLEMRPDGCVCLCSQIP